MNMFSEMEPLPDMAFCNDFANPEDIVFECNDPRDCCAGMREEYIIRKFTFHIFFANFCFLKL